MSSNRFRSPNKKGEEKKAETHPFFKALFKSIYRCGYEQGAIDLTKGIIKVEKVGDGYFLSKADEPSYADPPENTGGGDPDKQTD